MVWQRCKRRSWNGPIEMPQTPRIRRCSSTQTENFCTSCGGKTSDQHWYSFHTIHIMKRNSCQSRHAGARLKAVIITALKYPCCHSLNDTCAPSEIGLLFQRRRPWCLAMKACEWKSIRGEKYENIIYQIPAIISGTDQARELYPGLSNLFSCSH
jgi:hypothetical protein